MVDKRTVVSWNPSDNPEPSLDLIQALYLEFLNEYLTISVWGQAHNMDFDTAATFIIMARNIHESRVAILKAMPGNKNPNL